MSLINDALKRAKEAQQQVPLPQPDLPFRPIEPGQQRARRGLGLLLPTGLAAVACLVLFLVWQRAQSRQAAAQIEVTARTAPPPAPVAVNADPGMPIAAAQAGQSSQPASPLAPAGAAADEVATDAATDAADAMVTGAQESAATNAALAAAPAPPKPAPLRLQAIVFNPKRPSAMISGKLVFIGDKVRDLRIVAIDQESATLVGAGQTNVLSLAE